MIILALFLIISLSAQDDQEPEQELKTAQFSVPIQVNQNALSRSDCLFGTLHSTARINIETITKSLSFDSQKMQAGALHVRTIKSASENHPIIINGSLVVQRIYLPNKEEEEQLELIMLQKSPKFWKLKEHLDFNEQECHNLGGNGFLGGQCKNVDQKIVKEFRNLEKHEQVRIELYLHVFDQWEDEMIVMKVNGSVVWRNRFRNTLNGLNICGNEYSDSVNIKIDKIIKDNNENLKIEWEGITEKSSCEASFGIDNLMIHIK